MFLPEDLSEKAFYWGPLFVGVISLIVGAVVVRTDYDILHSTSYSSKITPQKKNRMSSLQEKKTQPPETTKHSQSLILDDDRTDSEGAENLLVQKADITKPLQNEQFDFQLSHQGWLAAQGFITLRARVQPVLIESYSLHYGQLGASLYRGVHYAKSGLEMYLVSEFGAWLGTKTQPIYQANAKIHKTVIDFSIKQHSETLALLGKPSLSAINRTKRRTDLFLFKVQGHEIGEVAFVTLDGLSNGIIGAQHLGYKSKFWATGAFIVNNGVAPSYKGVKIVRRRAVMIDKPSITASKKDTLQKNESILTAGIGSAINKTVLGQEKTEDYSSLACPDRYYYQISQLNKNKSAPIQRVVKLIGKPAVKLPGKWIFTLSSHKYKRVKRRRCVKYKWSSRLQKRRCIKWRYAGIQYRPSGTLFSKDEHKFIKKANLLIRRRGADPLVKARSPGQWVVKKVATDLKNYLGQKKNPAICTGAIAMVDYFEKHLQQIKTRIIQIKELSEESDVFIKRRHAALKAAIYKILDENGTGIARWKAWEIRTDNLQNALAQVSTPIFGKGAAEIIVMKPDFLSALSKTRQLFLREGTELSPETARALQNVYGALEASYYIRRLNEQYQELYGSLFGSLVSIRNAHSQHCNCDN